MDSTVNNWQGKMVGRYSLTYLLGRGGMGEVWQASDTHLGRLVAIKLLPSVRASNREYLDVFVNEARVAAALEHPHILALHDFGEQEVSNGEVVPYLVMPYVHGGTLRKRMQAAGSTLPVQTNLSFLRQAALAIDYAHDKQVLHRDVKPENMLLQQDWLLLSDFGLAKMLSGTSVHEKTHARSGTPEYMAPEHIQGEAVPASDLYSLAIIAYHLFTGHHPFRGETLFEILLKQMESMPPPPRELNASIPEEVERVLLQGLAKRPQDRPASCVAFVDALQQGWGSAAPDSQVSDSTLLAPVSLAEYSQVSISTQPFDSNITVATPDSVTTHLAGAKLTPQLVEQKPERTFGRRQILTGGIAAAAVVATAGVTTAAWLYNRNFTARKPSPTPTPLPGPKKLIAGVPVLALTGHTSEVWVAKWDPTGRYLVTAAGDQNVMLWDIAAALRNASSTPQTLTTPLRTYNIAGTKFDNTTGGLCWSLDGRKLIASHGFNEKAYVLDVFGKSSTPEVYTDSIALNMGTYIGYDGVCAGPLKDQFTVASGNFVQVWRFGKTDAPEKTLVTDKKLDLRIVEMAWSADGATLATIAMPGSDSLRLLLWSAGQLSPRIVNLPQRNPYLTFFRMGDTIAWSPVDPNLLLVSDADIAMVADLKRQMFIVALGLHNARDTPVQSGLSWSPNGRYVVGSYDVQGDGSHGQTFNPHIYIWDIDTLKKKVSPTATTLDMQDPTLSFGQQGSLQHTQSIVDIRWSPDGRYLATASLDKKVIIWKIDGEP